MQSAGLIKKKHMSSFIVQGTLSQERMPRPEITWGCGGKFPQASPDSRCCCCPWLQTPPSWHRSLGRKSKSGRFIANMYIVVVGDSWYCQIIITHSMEKLQSIETNMSQHASDSKYLFFFTDLTVYLKLKHTCHVTSCKWSILAMHDWLLSRLLWSCSSQVNVSMFNSRNCESLSSLSFTKKRLGDQTMSVFVTVTVSLAQRFCLTWVWAHEWWHNSVGQVANQKSRSSGKPKQLQCSGPAKHKTDSHSSTNNDMQWHHA